MRTAGFLAWFLLGAVFGCNPKDQKKCEQAIQVVHDAASRENFAAAEQWRAYAYKQCADHATLEALDRDLVGKRAEAEGRAREANERKQRTRELLKLFLQWVADNRTAPDKASTMPSCDPPAPSDAAKDKSKERFCTATRSAGSYQLSARYWEAEPAIARFNVKLPDVTSCEEIGATSPVRSWPVAAIGGQSVSRSRCEFPAGPLAGMAAVVSQAANADIYVFNPAYVDKEPTLRVILSGPP